MKYVAGSPQGIFDVQRILDDMIITGTDDEDRLDTLCKVSGRLKKLQSAS